MTDPEALKAAGWRLTESPGFTALAGPIWLRGEGVEREGGILLEQRHMNQAGALHGGVVMTFADLGLGLAAAAALNDTNCVTAQLNVHLVSSARIGEFISCKPELVRRTAQLIFVRGLIRTAEKTVASADGMWKVVEKRS